MNSMKLQELIDKCHEHGKKTAVSFCSHVPQELLAAAGICPIRIPYISNVKNAASRLLPRNVCPVVKNCCDICESGALRNADLLIAETSCDGKRKMYELISNQDCVYFYQVPQGMDRDYAYPLIYSECRHLVKELKKRFDIDVTEDAVRAAGELFNQERESILDLMEIQRRIPPAAWGYDIYQALEEHRMIPDIPERIAANRETLRQLTDRESPVPKDARRILVTGCPLSGVYQKILMTIEENNGVVVCIENCEVVKSAVRHFDTANEDVYAALASCYQNTACAIMSPNTLRFRLLERLVDEYHVDGVIDITMPTCHPYTVERDKMSRLCEDSLAIPYMAVETDISDESSGQLATRIAAFIEML